MHRSRLGALIIDCRVDDLAEAAEFWSAALGGEVHAPDDKGRFVDLLGDPSEPHVILQKVDHPSRVHLDIETDDIEAEVLRLQGIGAKIVEKMERWTVMEAPSGHRFCVIGTRRDGFDEHANRWD